MSVWMSIVYLNTVELTAEQVVLILLNSLVRRLHYKLNHGLNLGKFTVQLINFLIFNILYLVDNFR